MKKRAAICFRGKALDNSVNSKTNHIEQISYMAAWGVLKRKLIEPNKEYFDFDIYLHGWVDDISTDRLAPLLNDMSPKAHILELQRDFREIYLDVIDHEKILFERYRHLSPGMTVEDYSDIDHNMYFQNVLSYAYSISKSAEMVRVSGEEYDVVITARYDAAPLEMIDLKKVEPEFAYVDKNQGFSPIFIGDFYLASSQRVVGSFSNFFDFLQNKIFHDSDFLAWFERCKDMKKKFPNGRFEHGAYSNQVIFAYFLWTQGLDIERIREFSKGQLMKGEFKEPFWRKLFSLLKP